MTGPGHVDAGGIPLSAVQAAARQGLLTDPEAFYWLIWTLELIAREAPELLAHNTGQASVRLAPQGCAFANVAGEECEAA